MKSNKQMTAVLVVALVATGWYFGRSMGSEVGARPIREKLDPHVVISAPSLANAPRVLRRPQPEDAITDTRHPLQPTVEEAFHERDDDEWQGMLVDMSMRQICDGSSSCGLALSCRSDGKCGPCEWDADCVGGEACVLDHCVPASQVECRSRRDCRHVAEDAYCVLSGLTGGEHRGNSKMRSHCQASVGGTQQHVAEEPNARQQRAGARVQPSFDRRALLEDLKRRRGSDGR